MTGKVSQSFHQQFVRILQGGIRTGLTHLKLVRKRTPINSGDCSG